MITALYGLPGLSFAELTYLLTELGIGFMAVTDKPSKVGEPDRAHIVPVVFASVRSFMMHHKKIKFRAVGLVCDTYTKLRIEHDFEVVGVEETSKKKHRYTQFHKEELGALLQEADKLTTRISVGQEGKVYDPASEMIKKFSQSALSQSQTMMYKVKDQEARSKTFALVKGWFLGDVKTVETLQGRLRAVHSNDKYLTELMIVMTSPQAMTLRRVAIESRKNPDKIEALTKKANISPFDVRYLLSKGKRLTMSIN